MYVSQSAKNSIKKVIIVLIFLFCALFVIRRILFSLYYLLIKMYGFWITLYSIFQYYYRFNKEQKYLNIISSTWLFIY